MDPLLWMHVGKNEVVGNRPLPQVLCDLSVYFSCTSAPSLSLSLFLYPPCPYPCPSPCCFCRCFCCCPPGKAEPRATKSGRGCFLLLDTLLQSPARRDQVGDGSAERKMGIDRRRHQQQQYISADISSVVCRENMPLLSLLFDATTAKKKQYVAVKFSQKILIPQQRTRSYRNSQRGLSHQYNQRYTQKKTNLVIYH